MAFLCKGRSVESHRIPGVQKCSRQSRGHQQQPVYEAACPLWLWLVLLLRPPTHETRSCWISPQGLGLCLYHILAAAAATRSVRLWRVRGCWVLLLTGVLLSGVKSVGLRECLVKPHLE